MTRSVIIGTGSYLPKRVMDNHEITQFVETSDAWIRERTGITQRHIAADGEFTSDLAAKAAENALHHAGIQAADIDLIIVATTTPDNTFPSTAWARKLMVVCHIPCRADASPLPVLPK